MSKPKMLEPGISHLYSPHYQFVNKTLLVAVQGNNRARVQATTRSPSHHLALGPMLLSRFVYWCHLANDWVVLVIAVINRKINCLWAGLVNSNLMDPHTYPNTLHSLCRVNCSYWI